MGEFVTLFFPLPIQNVHLAKDVGLIPYYMGKLHGYEARLVAKCDEAPVALSYLETVVPGLRLEELQSGHGGAFAYLTANARKISVLNLYFLSIETLIAGIVYKKLNPRGFLYVKADLSNEAFERKRKKRTAARRRIRALIDWEFCRCVDLISAETRAGRELLQKHFPKIASRIAYVPNGVDDLFLQKTFPNIRGFREKENILLSVGRIGLPFKNHPMLMEAITRLDTKDWRFYFIGPIEPDFQAVIDRYFVERPELRERVIFTGNIADRAELYRWYDRSKIQCATSKFTEEAAESFAIALVEGLYFGNYTVSTDAVASCRDITRDGRLGSVVPSGNVETLARVLQDLIDDPSTMEKAYPEILAHSRENFIWSKSVSQLDRAIKGL